MQISCIIATYKREKLLARAVKSVLQQEVDADFEVIVVNDSGEPLSPADWQKDTRVRVYLTNRSERSFARNAGLAMAKGEYVHILDDDDYMLPGAYETLLSRARETDADWVHGYYEFLDRDEEFVDEVRPVWQGRVFAVALIECPYIAQPSLVKRETVMNVGGYDPAFTTTQDTELFLRIAAAGQVIVSNAVVCKILLGNTDASHTKYWLRKDMNRMLREKAFGRRDCLRLLLKSFKDVSDPWVRGRIVRCYIGSAVRNLRSGAIMTSFSRLWGMMVISLAGVVRWRFWRAVLGR